ncbi:MAG: uroporphyrinogen-III synthase [Sphingomonas sp.]|nr:uroporphyrinogen-III synthase [Sphingomonas sp.]
MKPLLVLRPEPGNRATVERARAIGLEPLACPLFSVQPVAWTAPDRRGFDAMLFTSANALRHGGEKIARLTTLPALAVGPATADAARASGFDVTMTGDDGVEALLAALPGTRRLLHLTGTEHCLPDMPHEIKSVVVYRSVVLAGATIPSGKMVALVHSPRAGACLAVLIRDRRRVSIAAISVHAADACGPGWAAVVVAHTPNDGSLLAVAARLCQD